jgi:hypothetical protein
MAYEKLTASYQNTWHDRPIFDQLLLSAIDEKVTLHKEISNVLSSAAACVNVLGGLNNSSEDIKHFFAQFSLNIQEVINFPSGVNLDGEIYNDTGPIIFEWIGPRHSPINERGGTRGQRKTSIDAFLIAVIDNKITQLFIEWKFTEKYNSEGFLQKFGGLRGVERLRRYSSILVKLRGSNKFPFAFADEGLFGLYDFGWEPFYQLLRMTLLAKMTTPLQLTPSIKIEDYKVLHLVHSGNDQLKSLEDAHVKYTPGISEYAGRDIHDIWKNELLSPTERDHFVYGHWDKAISTISDSALKSYLTDRYA